MHAGKSSRQRVNFYTGWLPILPLLVLEFMLMHRGLRLHHGLVDLVELGRPGSKSAHGRLHSCLLVVAERQVHVQLAGLPARSRELVRELVKHVALVKPVEALRLARIELVASN